MELIEELENFRVILADVEQNQQQNLTSGLILDSKSLSPCLQLCKQGVEPLRELTVALSKDLDGANKLRRKWGSAKVVLKKAQLDKYRVKLERALRLLAFSHQLYTRYARLTCPCVTYPGPRICALCPIPPAEYWEPIPNVPKLCPTDSAVFTIHGPVLLTLLHYQIMDIRRNRLSVLCSYSRLPGRKRGFRRPILAGASAHLCHLPDWSCRSHACILLTSTLVR